MGMPPEGAHNKTHSGGSDMEKIITLENLRLFAYCNHAICAKPINGFSRESH